MVALGDPADCPFRIRPLFQFLPLKTACILQPLADSAAGNGPPTILPSTVTSKSFPHTMQVIFWGSGPTYPLPGGIGTITAVQILKACHCEPMIAFK
jgi:hypothetical protein